MKTIPRMLFAAVITTGAVALSALTADAQGLAASPKVQQMLNDRQAVVVAAARPVKAEPGKVCCALTGIAASPKVRQALDERPKCCGLKGQGQALVDPGLKIAASPKLREQLAGRY